MTKTMPWTGEGARPTSATVLYVAAAVLRAASDVLARHATHLTAVRTHVEPMPETVEFHALHSEAGAPEGALYVNGKLVGTIAGVTRL